MKIYSHFKIFCETEMKAAYSVIHLELNRYVDFT